jgi:ubiquinol-cytochrome c reductase cytochrome c subunit
MRGILRPSRIFPVALIAIALGLALNSTSASAVASSSQGGGGTNPAAQPKIVGSGNENVYSVQSGTLPDVPNPGQYLFTQGCSTCHGVNGQGTTIAPSLIGVGAAAVDFYISTGRMPLNHPEVQAQRKKPLYNDVQRKAIVDYVSSLAEGPAIPHVDTSQGDLVEGNELYANNCAGCHNSAGSGGALGRDYYAPRLYSATDQQIGEAVRIGPGAMPVFGPNTFTDQQVDSLVKYVNHLKDAHSPGGVSIGRIGPVSEGFFAWVVGLGLLLLVTRWIGTRV